MLYCFQSSIYNPAIMWATHQPTQTLQTHRQISQGNRKGEIEFKFNMYM